MSIIRGKADMMRISRGINLVAKDYVGVNLVDSNEIQLLSCLKK